MGPSDNSKVDLSRDGTVRSSTAAICQIEASIYCFLLLAWQALGSSAAWAQPAFAPPPPPRASAVRGIYDPAQPSASPATIAPPVPQSAAVSPQSTDVVSDSILPTSSAGAQPLEGGEIVARVDGQIVLASDVLWQVNQIIEANRDRIAPEQIEVARRSILRQQVMGLIDTKLLYADFRRTVPSENIPQIEKNLVEPFEESEVPRLVKVLEVKDRRALAELLEARGSSLADVQRQFNERTIAGEWLRQKTPKPKPVTHEQMLEYYQEHLAKYDYPARAKWEELMLRFDRFEGDRTATWRAMAELGNQLWQRVQANPAARGPVFVELAKEQSHGFTAAEGGQHDWTTRGALRGKSVDEALFTLQVGQLSNILESESGFHIVRVLEREEAGRTSFEEAQAAIRDELEASQKRELVEEELVKLRKQSRVWTVFDGEFSGPQVAELLGQQQKR
ncbi:MAG: peptidyl-prolyl cis-trans isomerase [Planctomycetales bacterium]|nr:peptidyl-prolyl cis-trans isomerase [Planctomycetales bacterium]